jgi:hypothetical protein
VPNFAVLTDVDLDALGVQVRNQIVITQWHIYDLQKRQDSNDTAARQPGLSAKRRGQYRHLVNVVADRLVLLKEEIQSLRELAYQIENDTHRRGGIHVSGRYSNTSAILWG